MTDGGGKQQENPIAAVDGLKFFGIAVAISAILGMKITKRKRLTRGSCLW